MATANYTVSNLTNRTLEIDGVQWAAGQVRDLIFITSSVDAAADKGLVSVVKNTGDDGIIAAETTSAVLTNNTVQPPFNNKDL